MRPCTVRKLEPADAHLWAALRWEALTRHPLAFGSSPPDNIESLAESVRARLSSREQSVVFGAFEEASLIGIVGVVRETEKKSRHKSRIWGMYVTATHRRAGVGALLLDAAIEQARSWQGILQVSLSVTDVAHEAQRLYERRGFRAWGREPRALGLDGQYADEVYMVLDLDRQTSAMP
jgi:GNAT superfamily N-acetyltransferase